MQIKLLFFDIETTPLISYTWGTYDQTVIEVMEEWYLLCFSYKWQGKSVKAEKLINGKKTERELVVKMWKLLDEADVVVAHNGRKFDVKKVNAKFLEYGLDVPSPYKIIDTLTEARKYFALTSNKLDSIGKYLGVGRKVKHPGFEMWKGCMENEDKWWKLMIKYNKQDVLLLEKVYQKLLPWITQPTALWSKVPCPHCGSPETQNRGKATTGGGKTRKRHQCTDCGKWFLGNYIIKKV